MGWGILSPIKKSIMATHKSNITFLKNPSVKTFKANQRAQIDSSLGGHSNVFDKDKPVTTNDAAKAGSASDQMGGIYRAQWDDYVNRFQPTETQVVDLATGQADNEDAIARARGSVAGAYGVSQGTVQRDRERLGLSSAGTNVDEQPIMQARTGLGQAAAEVSAMNGARAETNNRDMQLLSGNMAVGLRPVDK